MANITAEERKQSISLALNILREVLIETNSSMAIGGKYLVFFGTDDYAEVGDIKKIPNMAVKIDDLVK